jgi:hypothetical protein
MQQTTPKRTSAGRPLLAEGIRAQAARRAKDAVQALVDVAGNADAPADARVEAAKVLLTHATMHTTPQKVA